MSVTRATAWVKSLSLFYFLTTLITIYKFYTVELNGFVNKNLETV